MIDVITMMNIKHHHDNHDNHDDHKDHDNDDNDNRQNPTHFFILNNSTHTPLPLSSSIVSICLTPASPYYPFWYLTPFLLDPGILGPIYGSEPP